MGSHINMAPDDSITISTNYKNDNTNNDGLVKYNKLQVGDTRKEATTRLEVQFFIKAAGVRDLQEEVRHCLATTLQEISPSTVMCYSNHPNDKIQTSEPGKLLNSNLNRGAAGSINRRGTYREVKPTRMNGVTDRYENRHTRPQYYNHKLIHSELTQTTTTNETQTMDMGTFQHTPGVLIAIVITEKSRLYQVECYHIYIFVVWHCHSYIFLFCV